MADNVAFTPGTGATVATDDIGGVHYQRNKIVLGADGTALDLIGTAERGAYVDPRPANTRIQVQSAGLTIATTAYTAGDQLGTILEFANVPRAAGGYATLVQAILIDDSGLVGPVELYLFDRSVTLAADNAAASMSDADMAFLVGVIDFPLPKVLGANKISLGMPLPQVVKANATSIFGALVTRVGHTFFPAVTDLRITLTFQQD